MSAATLAVPVSECQIGSWPSPCASRAGRRGALRGAFAVALVDRVLCHALTGKPTSARERFLGSHMPQVFRRRRPHPALAPVPSRAA